MLLLVISFGASCGLIGCLFECLGVFGCLLGVPGRLSGGLAALLVAFGGPLGVSLGVSVVLGGIIGSLFECLGVFGCLLGVPGRLLGGFVVLFVPTGAPSSVLLAALLS